MIALISPTQDGRADCRGVCWKQEVVMSESLEPQIARPGIDVPVHTGQAPGQEIRPPAADEADVKAAVFADPEREEQPPSLLGFAAAGMLVHDLMQGCSHARPADEDDDEEQPKPKAPAE
jgi:hypothetical protein